MHTDDFRKFCAHPLFAGLSVEEMFEIEALTSLRSYPAKTQILTAGECCDTVYLLLGGSVKLSVSRHPRSGSLGAFGTNGANANDMLVSIVGVGEVLGAVSVLGTREQMAGVSTLEAARFACIRADTFMLLLERYPAISRNLNLLLADVVRQTMRHVQALSTLDVPGRIAFQLLHFAGRYAHQMPGGELLLSIRITQNDLASLCGASREQINRILTSWPTAS